MVDIVKAIAFVQKRGNRLDRLRLRRALGESFTLAEAEEVSDEPLVVKGMARLLDLQEDGIWPDPHTPVETMITTLRLLRDYEVGL